MTTLLLPLVVSLGTCLVLTPVVRALATRLGLVDHPDGRRKMHDRAIPVAGGIAILLSGAAGVAVALAWPSWLQDALMEFGGGLGALLVASVILCAVGVADGYGCVRGRHKFLGQVVAVAVLIGCGLEVRQVSLLGWDLDLGPLAVPFTAFWLLGAINSLNLIDGMDGLLSCVGLIICLAMAVMGVVAGRWEAVCIALALAGALLGFLRYNFPPASIFLGDCGSMLIGLVVGVVAIQSSLKSPATIVLATPLAVLTIPVFDTTAAILRRKLTGRSLYTTDRGHLHHCLLRRGLSNRAVLGFVSFFSLVAALGALASFALHNEVLAVGVMVGLVGVLVVTGLFGRAEFVLLKERVCQTALSLVSGNGTPRQMEVQLQGEGDWKEVWDVLTSVGNRLNLLTIRLDVNAPAMHQGYHARWDRFEDEADDLGRWRAEIPLSIRGRTVGRLEIAGQRDREPVWAKIATLCQILEKFEAELSGMPEDSAQEVKQVPDDLVVPVRGPELEMLRTGTSS
jgi:UDP-GlcNAc:undecaprenyl-phosphate GlcNAc-1-phosphate transferase